VGNLWGLTESSSCEDPLDDGCRAFARHFALHWREFLEQRCRKPSGTAQLAKSTVIPSNDRNHPKNGKQANFNEIVGLYRDQSRLKLNWPEKGERGSRSPNVDQLSD
jgi:hypothetical protein